MIYVSKEQLKQVEYLIAQSMQGNHVLFDSNAVRKVFTESHQLNFEDVDAYAVEHHIEKLMTQPSIAQKRAYLERLDTITFNLVVRTYFNIVENNLFETQEIRH